MKDFVFYRCYVIRRPRVYCTVLFIKHYKIYITDMQVNDAETYLAYQGLKLWDKSFSFAESSYLV